MMNSSIFLDVRSNDEYEVKHIKNAIPMPFSAIYCNDCIHKLQRNKKIIVYCNSGIRSKIACGILIQNDFKKVYNLKGGINAWINSGFPIESNKNGYFCNCSIIKNIDTEKKLFEIMEEIRENNANWIAGYASVSNISNKYRLLGWIYEDENKYETISYSGPIPDEFDWRNVNGTDWTTPIKNQGNCGSCVAFATIGALESVVQINVGIPFNCDLSEAHLFFCGGGTCDGGWSFSKAFPYVKTNGVPDELCFPYHPNDMPCSKSCSNWKQRAVKVSYIGAVSGIESIQKALLKYGPLITGMAVYEDFYHYRGGIYQHVSGEYEGGHGVVIVGYNNRQQCWICKNSWGTGWGENGWFRIKYGDCDIGKPAYYLLGISGDIQPFQPYNPSPYNKEINVETSIDLSWDCKDPDGDNVYYDIYLAKNHPPTKNNIVASHYASNSIHVNLDKNSRYYWKVIAEDEHGAKNEGQIWTFATIETTPPNVKIVTPEEGYLYWDWLRIPIFTKNAIIISGIDIEVDANDASGINRVEFYLNNILQFNDTIPPYTWNLNEKSFGLKLYEIKVIAYDNVGNSAYDTVRIRIFNI